ncbi:MAG: DNA mismatch repair protein MutS [Pseudomonadota bacterium]
MTVQPNTPMMDQYLSIKEMYPDAILFYRMGDFYEMFLEDAHKASRILEIALTSRNKNQETPIPMCGIPFRAADVYIAKLIGSGCKVAICEQVEDPALAKGLVRREVVRVITPGMILNESLLDRTSNNFLVALTVNDGFAGLSCLDISTGLFRTTQTRSTNGKIPASIIDETLRMDPREILLPASFKKDPSWEYLKRAFPGVQVTYLDKLAFHPVDGRNRLAEKFKTRSLEGFGCEHLTAGTAAAGAILHYIQETQLQDTRHILRLEPYVLNSYLILDDRCCRNLELVRNIQTGDRKGTLISVLDKTVTSMGGRLFKHWIRYPLKDMDAVEKRFDAVLDAKSNAMVRQSIRTHLKDVYDLERLGSRISMGHGNARDLVALKTTLLKLPVLMSELEVFPSSLFRCNDDIRASELENPSPEGAVRDLVNLAETIHKAIREDAPPVINEGGIICDGYNRELDELMEIARDGRAWIARAGAEEKEKTGLSSLKIKYNKVFGYFLEVSKGQAAQVPDHYIRKQTLVNAERFITEDLKVMESKVLNAQEQRAKIEYSLFLEIREHVVRHTPLILAMAGFLARTDVLLGLAEAAEANNYTRPELNTKGVIDIRDGRHPVVEAATSGERYVPNTVFMDNETQQVLIITGPNMAGKSTVLRQVALIALMAQMGSFVPASRASLCIIDRIFTRVGALDNLSQGQSTFMVEMEETANIVNNVSGRSLVILDEIGRGTSTFDGMSIAWAVAEYLHDFGGTGVKTLFATHYHELTRLEQIHPRIKNFNIAVKEFHDNIIFLRRLVQGGTNKSYGIQVARLAGIPDSVIAKAKLILSEISRDNGASAASREKEIPDKAEQLDLFRSGVAETIITRLEAMDLYSMTPIQAMNALNSLKQELTSQTASVSPS